MLDDHACALSIVLVEAYFFNSLYVQSIKF